MSDFIDISLVGEKQLQAYLKKLDFQLQKKIVRSANSKAMLPVRNKAKQLSPVETGALRNSIKRISKTKKGISRVSIVTGTRDVLNIPKNIKGYYPAAHEYGYTKTNGDKVAAKSFMRAALTGLKGSVISNIGKFIAQGIAKVK